MNAITLKTESIAELAGQVNDYHRAFCLAGRQMLGIACAAGGALIKIKPMLKHGEFLRWVEANTEMSIRTAQAYMQLSRGAPSLEANTQNAALLPLREALAALSSPKTEPKDWQAEIDAAAAWCPVLDDESERITVTAADTVVCIAPSAKHPGCFYVETIREDGIEGMRRPIKRYGVGMVLKFLGVAKDAQWNRVAPAFGPEVSAPAGSAA